MMVSNDDFSDSHLGLQFLMTSPLFMSQPSFTMVTMTPSSSTMFTPPDSELSIMMSH